MPQASCCFAILLKIMHIWARMQKTVTFLVLVFPQIPILNIVVLATHYNPPPSKSLASLPICILSAQAHLRIVQNLHRLTNCAANFGAFLHELHQQKTLTAVETHLWHACSVKKHSRIRQIRQIWPLVSPRAFDDPGALDMAWMGKCFCLKVFIFATK